MLKLIDIKKDYEVAGESVHALKGITINFRKNEFVSVLGASGCGKTTLLNIIGGLDKYTSGDLIIEGRSTKSFKDGDWDTYRNHSIGFIFQSYHLIPHQTILQNVELALTISGVEKAERKRRAIEALEKVGLGDKIHNRPNQLSGGQAQRVAIARALINDPEIVLADEPTGALDSKTSVQIMELLKEISRDRLVIMVTHNPELAEQYSTRIIRLLDGEMINDSMPYDGEENAKEILPEHEPEQEKKPETGKGRKKKSSMSVGMAFMLSLKNLLSKCKRTVMVSVAGSIGIIGVSLVLAISAGVHNYIVSMEDDLLSGYPLTVSQSAVNFESLMLASMSDDNALNPVRLSDKIYVDSVIESLMKMGSSLTSNNITEEYINYVEQMPAEYYNAIMYSYGFEPANNIFTNFKLDENDPGEEISVTGMRAMYGSVLSAVGEKDGNEQFKAFTQVIPTIRTFYQMPNNYDYILSQYDILATNLDKTSNFTGDELKEIFENKDSMIMVVNDGATADLYLGQFGYFTQEEFLNFAERAKNIADGKNDTSEFDGYIQSYLDGKDYDFFIDKDGEYTFKWYPNDSIYGELGNLPPDLIDIPDEYKPLIDNFYYQPYSAQFMPNRDKSNDVELKVKVILQKKENVSYGCLSSGFYYTEALTGHFLETGLNSRVVNYIEKNTEGYLKSMPFTYHYTFDGVKENGATLFQPRSADMMSMMSSIMGGGDGTDLLAAFRVPARYLGGDDIPESIYMYISDFKTKDLVTAYLDEWNKSAKAQNAIAYGVDGKEVLFGADSAGSVRYADGSTDTVTESAFGDISQKIKAELNKGNGVTYIDSAGAEAALVLRGTFSWTETAENGEKIEHTVILSEKDNIEYTDTVGLIISMVNTMIDMVTFALVAFTALALVVSTVMVGIITYVSVVERVKEIGILRAVGARKKDIKRLFNAETFIIGLAAGIVGIGVTYILSLILNLIVSALAPISAIAALPIWQALVMIAISVGLTLISGLIPASAAAKKDPVVALRTE